MPTKTKTEPKPRGRPQKLQDPVSFVLRLERPLHQQLRNLAAKRDLSLNDLITEALVEWTRPQHQKRGGSKRG